MYRIMVDSEDLKILNILKKDAKLSVRDISKKTGVPPTTAARRISNLKKSGIIKGYTIDIDMKKIGKPTIAYILMNVDFSYFKHEKMLHNTTAQQIIKYPYIEECATITGRFDLIAKIRVENIHELDRIVNKLRNEGGITRTETLIVLYDEENRSKPLNSN